MSIMYCPNCEKNTNTKRDNFSFLVAFILAFTGIGLIIYILYHLDKKPNRCVYCETVCQPRKMNDKQISSIQQLQNNANNYLESQPLETGEIKVNYCHNCGTELGDR